MKRNIRDQSAQQYRLSHIVGQLSCERMLEKLDWIRFNPASILVLGLSSGDEVKRLKSRFPSAHVTVIDASLARLQEETDADVSLHQPLSQLDFSSASFDCVISNVSLHQVADPFSWIKSVFNILKPMGLFLFSCYGPATLSELQTAFSRIDANPHAADFFDMHDLGDAMKKLAYENIGMDQEMLTLTYQKLTDLFLDLKNIGELNQHPGRRRTLMTHRQLSQLKEAYEVFRAPEGHLVVSVELIYGLSWKGQPKPQANSTEICIPISAIKKTKEYLALSQFGGTEYPKDEG